MYGSVWGRMNFSVNDEVVPLQELTEARWSQPSGWGAMGGTARGRLDHADADIKQDALTDVSAHAFGAVVMPMIVWRGREDGWEKGCRRGPVPKGRRKHRR